MEMIPVQSSSIAAIGYDNDTQTLRIQFKGKDNPEWEYDEVPPLKYYRLQKAHSPGAYFHENIKGKHPGRKVAS